MKNAHQPQTLGLLIQHFFTQYLQEQRNVSPCTIAAYRDTFRLLFEFTKQHLHRQPAQLELSDLSASLVLSFLAYLEEVRHNTVRTRNSRLAAIRSFMHFVSLKEPVRLAACEQILAIPVKRFERPLIGYLSREQVEALLSAPDIDSWSGRRDRALLTTMYNTGARVSEVIGMRVSDFSSTPSASVLIHGKGRKQRTVPLWSSTAQLLQQWLEFASQGAGSVLFPNRKGGQLSRTGVADRLTVTATRAAQTCSSLSTLRVTPHLIRHSTAMHLLQSGVDINVIALWLGHESPSTTHGYIEADLAMKERAMNAIGPPNQTQCRFQADDELMAFLERL